MESLIATIHTIGYNPIHNDLTEEQQIAIIERTALEEKLRSTQISNSIKKLIELKINALNIIINDSNHIEKNNSKIIVIDRFRNTAINK